MPGRVEVVEERLAFTVDGLALEGVLAYPAQGVPDATWCLLAPHPHLGGRMDNNVVRHLARRAAEDGAATLRFDYRGVGRSAIRLPEGTSVFEHFAAMEREQRYEALEPDVESAWRALLESVGPTARRILVGYSLGAVPAGRLGERLGATHVVAVSPPVARVRLAVEPFPGPRLFLAGDADFAFDRACFEAEYAVLPEPKFFVRLAGADHFFRQEEERVYAAVAGWLASG